jgi:putative phosphoserine phosphatase/1-acylglycerol-3-phosphate O-acyltransferase
VRPERALAALAYLARFLTFPFVRYDVRGGTHLNDTIGAAVIAANHRSLFDIVAGLIAFQRYGRYPRVLIEKRYVDAKWTRPFARAIGAIPVDRAAGRGEAFRAAVEALDQGLTILILPEGRLHWDPERPLSTGPASTGVSRLAEASGVPVCPVAIVGTERIWPATRWLPRFRPFRRRRVVTIRISDQLVEFEGEDHRARTEQVMAAIRALMAVATADAAVAAAGR